jgi:hypothetical protein
MSDKNLQDIKDAITDAGSALLAYSKTGSVFLPLDGDLYVAVGSLAGIAHVAGKSIDEAAPAAQAPSQVPAELTDERIIEIIARIGSHSLNVTRAHELGGKTSTIMEDEGVIEFARAIERELRAGSSDVRDKALQWISVDERLPEPGRWLVAVETDDGMEVHSLDLNKKNQWMHEGEPTFCHGYYFHPMYWAPLPAAPAASKEGGEHV